MRPPVPLTLLAGGDPARPMTDRPTAPLVAAVLLGLLLAACGSAGRVAQSRASSPLALSGTSSPRVALLHVQTAVAPFRLPAALSRAVAVAPAPGRLEVLGGLHDSERSTGAVVRIDVRTGTVTVAGQLPTAVHDAAGGLLAGEATLLGGGNSAEVATIQQVGASGGSVTGRLPVPTSDAVAVGTSRGLVMVGGYDGTHTLGQILLVASPSRIVRLGSLPVPVRYPAVSLIGSGAAERVLVIGGEAGGVATDAVQEIDPASGATSMIGHLPAPRTQASALRLGGTVFVFGGASSGGRAATLFSDVLRWDDATRAFTSAGSLPYPVADAACVSPDGRSGYLIGGETPARVDTTIAVHLD